MTQGNILLIMSAVILGIYAAFCGYILYDSPSPEQVASIEARWGNITIGVAAFWFGSSIGSKGKSEQIERLKKE